MGIPLLLYVYFRKKKFHKKQRHTDTGLTPLVKMLLLQIQYPHMKFKTFQIERSIKAKNRELHFYHQTSSMKDAMKSKNSLT